MNIIIYGCIYANQIIEKGFKVKCCISKLARETQTQTISQSAS